MIQPDSDEVYEARVQIRIPSGEWVMFPTGWDAEKIEMEVNSAWVSPG